MKKLMIFILILFFMGCQGKDGSDGITFIDVSTDAIIVSNPSGYVEAASCEGYSEVTILPLNPQLKQTGHYHRGWLDSDHSGHYTIYADVLSTYGHYGFEGECRRETTGGTVHIKLESLIKMTDVDKNINYPNSIKSIVGMKHFFDSEHPDMGDAAASLATAQSEVLTFFNMPDTGMDFSEMSLQGDSTGDAVMTLISATIDLNKTGTEQSAFMKEIAEGILSNNQALKTSVNLITEGLPILAIKNNIDSMFVELDISADCPPIWFDSPAYYGDLLGRTPVVLESKNIGQTSTGTFELSTYSLFQYPIVFTNIEPARYIAFNKDGDLSIWTKGGLYNGYNIRGTKVLDLVKLNEVLLEGGLSSNYFLGESHGLTSGTEYILIQGKDADFSPSKLTTGDPVPFSQNSASDDDGLTWLPANVTSWFTRSIKYYTTD